MQRLLVSQGGPGTRQGRTGADTGCRSILSLTQQQCVWQTGSQTKQNKTVTRESLYLVLANFCGVNTPTVDNVKLSSGLTGGLVFKPQMPGVSLSISCPHPPSLVGVAEEPSERTGGLPLICCSLGPCLCSAKWGRKPRALGVSPHHLTARLLRLQPTVGAVSEFALLTAVCSDSPHCRCPHI